jgi:hypothetical protein
MGTLTSNQQSDFTVIAPKVIAPWVLQCRRACRFPSCGAYGQSTTVSRQARGGNLRLLPSLVEVGALLAEWLAAVTLPKVLLLNVISRVAVGIVVVDVLLDGMPRRFLGHFAFLGILLDAAPCGARILTLRDSLTQIESIQLGE